jgi:transcriptional regulator with XRE-family HTH domain
MFSEDKMTFMDKETSEATINRVLSSYEVGEKLRKLRLKKKIALAELGKHTGLSASLLSQLETGRMVPTLPTLARIAMVFDVGLDHFFCQPRTQRIFNIVRAAERIRFPERADEPVPAYFFECLAYATPGKNMQAYLAEFPLQQVRDRLHFHPGWEFVFVVNGSIGIRYQGGDYVLETGDSVYFEAGEPHGYWGEAAGSKAVVITLPPNQ